MRKNFYVFRHGETDINRQNRCQGSGIDVDINETGIKQAKMLADNLANVPLDVIFSSSLMRAKHTAKIVAECKNIPLFEKDNLRECFYGDAEGMLIDEIKQKYADVFNNWHNPNIWKIAYPNGETKEDALHRVWKQICLLLDTPYSNIGIAVHAGTMGCLLNLLNFDFGLIYNCAVFHLVYDDEEKDSWKVLGFI